MGYRSPARTTIHFFNYAFNPADSTTYYIGDNSYYGTVANVAPIYVPCAGYIDFADIVFWSVTATGTNEDISIYLRKNNTTDYLIATVGAASTLRRFKNTALNIPVAAGDYFELKMVCPAWATNPEGVRIGGYASMLI